MKIRIYILTFLFLASGLTLDARDIADAKQAFEQGNEAYKQGEYEAALAFYQKADSIANGVAIDYNLGNVYFKLDKLPQSILHYERVLKYDPGHADARHNLKLANTKIVDRIKVLPKSKIEIWWNEFRFGMGPDAWALVSILLAFLSVALIICYFLPLSRNMRRFGFFTGIIGVILTVLAIALAQSSEDHRDTHHTAIVFTDKVDVKSEPREQATNVFVLHAGTKIELLEPEADWYKVKIASGNQGWIKKSDLEKI